MERNGRTNAGRRIADVLCWTGLALVILLAALLVYESLWNTSVIDPLGYDAQHIYSIQENELTNLAALCFVFVILRLLDRIKLSKKFVRTATGVLFFCTAAFAAFWTLSAKAIPYSDQGMLIEYADLIIKGDTAMFSDTTSVPYFYFLRFPFQFGYLAYTEILLRLFGQQGLYIAEPLLNVLWLHAGYIAVVKTTDLLFDDRNVTFLTALLLASCTQLLFACTFCYGTIACAALSMWMIFFVVRYMKSAKKRNIGYAAVFAAFSVLMKSNAWIMIAACGIALMLFAIEKRRWFALLAVAVLFVCAMPGQKLVQKAYEKRIGTSFGSGYSMKVWMAMTMQESWMACGWYNMYFWDLYADYGPDAAAAERASEEMIAARLDIYAGNLDYAKRFYEEKLTSQWNEPTYMSVWISRTCKTYGESNGFVQDVYEGKLKDVFEWIQNQYVQMMFMGLLLYALALLRRRSAAQMIYPMAILGAVLFHLLFEANAKYALTYLPMFAPMTAYGFLRIGKREKKKESARAAAPQETAELAAEAAVTEHETEN